MTNDFAKPVIQKLPVTRNARLADTERRLINPDFHRCSPSNQSV
jgi:hypothetical protein